MQHETTTGQTQTAMDCDITQHIQHYNEDDDDNNDTAQQDLDSPHHSWRTLARNADLWADMEDEYIKRE